MVRDDMRSGGHDLSPERTSEWTTEDITPKQHPLWASIEVWTWFRCLIALFNIMVNHTPVVSQPYGGSSRHSFPSSLNLPSKYLRRCEAKPKYRSTLVNTTDSDIRCQGMAYFESWSAEELIRGTCSRSRNYGVFSFNSVPVGTQALLFSQCLYSQWWSRWQWIIWSIFVLSLDPGKLSIWSNEHASLLHIPRSTHIYHGGSASQPFSRW